MFTGMAGKGRIMAGLDDFGAELFIIGYIELVAGDLDWEGRLAAADGLASSWHSLMLLAGDPPISL